MDGDSPLYHPGNGTNPGRCFARVIMDDTRCTGSKNKNKYKKNEDAQFYFPALKPMHF